MWILDARRMGLAAGLCALLGWHNVLFAQPRPVGSAQASALQWKAEGRSAGGREIEVLRAGTGPVTVVILGSLTGNEPQTAQMLDAIAETVRKFPPPDFLKLILVRSPNPDGLRDHIATNASGVDLSRGFPSALALPVYSPAVQPKPASAPEIQFLVTLLSEAKPSRVIHVRGNYTQQSLVEVAANFPEMRGQAVLPTTVAANRLNGELRIGSLEEFCQRTIGAQVASVFLPAATEQSLQATDVLRLSTVSLPGANTLAKEPRSPQSRPLGDVNDVVGQARKREVEFLPPPPEYVATSNAGPNGQGLRPRYQDLPPPPRQR